MKVYWILLVLFVISVMGPEVARIFEIPAPWNKVLVLSTAFGIALVKAYYVVAYFMHLKFEKKIVSYMLVTTLVFMFLFFFAVAPDVMKHEGSNWSNAAAKNEVIRALKEQKEGPQKAMIAANLLPIPKSLKEYSRTGETTYRIPVDKAMEIIAHDTDRGKGMTIIMPLDPNAPPPEVMAAAQAKFTKLKGESRPSVTFDPKLAEAGKALFTTKTCNSCHSIDGSKKVGPTFKNIIGRVTMTTKAEAFRNDKAYFIESVKNPKAKISNEYVGGVMPNLGINDADTDALYNYAASLSVVAAAPTPAPVEAGGDDPKPAEGDGEAAPKEDSKAAGAPEEAPKAAPAAAPAPAPKAAPAP
jgi:caa(3)-type oxidase subunit IV